MSPLICSILKSKAFFVCRIHPSLVDWFVDFILSDVAFKLSLLTHDVCMHDLNVKYLLSQTGSKDETFFDSKPWLDSDGEDDFYSVNGGKNISCSGFF